MSTPPPQIPEEQLTPLLVKHLLRVIQGMSEQLQKLIIENETLKDQIAKLKNQKPKPDIKPSFLNKDSQQGKGTGISDNKRPGSAKRKKTAELIINEEKLINAENVPLGSRFKEYSTFTVQNMIIKSHVVQYKLEHWIDPEGNPISRKNPNT